MTTYAFNHADTGAVSSIVADSDHDAQLAAEGRLDCDDLVWADQWDADGHNDDGQPMERLLCWASEADAENDSGVNSIGYLSVVR